MALSFLRARFRVAQSPNMNHSVAMANILRSAHQETLLVNSRCDRLSLSLRPTVCGFNSRFLVLGKPLTYSPADIQCIQPSLPFNWPPYPDPVPCHHHCTCPPWREAPLTTCVVTSRTAYITALSVTLLSPGTRISAGTSRFVS